MLRLLGLSRKIVVIIILIMEHQGKRVTSYSSSIRPKAQKSRGTEIKHHQPTVQLPAGGPWKGAGQIQVEQDSQSSWRPISLSLYPAASTWASYRWERVCASDEPSTAVPRAELYLFVATLETTAQANSSKAHPKPPSVLPWRQWKQVHDHRSLKD